LKCLDIRYFWRAIGEVLEDIDFELIEDYHAIRQGIRLKVFLTLNDALWMADFLSSTTKRLHIDGVLVDVVNAEQEVLFDLFKDTQIAATPTLSFLKKDIGLINLASETVAYTGKSLRIVT
jgi:hypothetical protein